MCLPPRCAVRCSLRRALCQSAAWSRSCRRRSGPTTQELRGCTSTKGYECAAPSSKHCHNTAAGSVLASLPALLIQCAKVKFVSPHFHHSDGCLRTPSLSQSLCNEMFAFVNVIVDFIVNCLRRFSPRVGWMKSMFYHDRYSGPCKTDFKWTFYFLYSIFFCKVGDLLIVCRRQTIFTLSYLRLAGS